MSVNKRGPTSPAMREDDPKRRNTDNPDQTLLLAHTSTEMEENSSNPGENDGTQGGNNNGVNNTQTSNVDS